MEIIIAIAIIAIIYYLIGTILMIICEFSPFIHLEITSKNTGEEITGFIAIYLKLCIYYNWIITFPLIYIWQNKKNSK